MDDEADDDDDDDIPDDCLLFRAIFHFDRFMPGCGYGTPCENV